MVGRSRGGGLEKDGTDGTLLEVPRGAAPMGAAGRAWHGSYIGVKGCWGAEGMGMAEGWAQ